MKAIDGRQFWLHVDSLIAAKGMSLGDFCKKADMNYNTVSYQRVRRALPKIEQLLGMSEVLGISIEDLVSGKDGYKKPAVIFTPRIMNIASHCMTATEEDLILVERILRIDPPSGEKSSASGAFA